MVKFGFDEDTTPEASQDYHKNTYSNSDRIAEDGPDDTFEYRSSHARIPGGFDFLSPIALRKKHDDTPLLESVSSNATHCDDTDHPMEYNPVTLEEPGQNEGTLHTEDAVTPNRALDSGEEPPEFSEEASEQDDMEMYSSEASKTPSHIRATDWPSQIRHSGARFQLIGCPKPYSKSELPRNKRRSDTKRPEHYDTHDLDVDLFGKPSMSRPRTREHKTTGSHAHTVRFAFNWTKQGFLIQNKPGCRNVLTFQNPYLKASRSGHEHCLRSLLAVTDIKRTYGPPYAMTRSDMTANTFVDESMAATDRSLWNLVSALFDPLFSSNTVLPELDAASGAALQTRLRDQRFSQWLADAVANTVKSDVARATNIADKIFAQLTGNQRSEACANAISVGNFRLATLIPLAGGDRSVMQDVEQQVSAWRKKNELQYIDKSYRNIYELLSGNATVLQTLDMAKHDNNEELNLDWKRAFGLHFWFRASEDTQIIQALSSYEAAFLRDPNVSPPKICYIDRKNGDHTFRKHLDIHYQLIKLYTDPSYPQETLFDPLTIRNSPLDVQNSWLLFIFVCKSGRLPLAPDLSTSERQVFFDQLSANFSSQLEASGQWQWAVFVILHVENTLMREALLKSLLARHSQAIDGDLESFLTKQLKIPGSWIIEAKALHCRACGDFVEEVRLLMSAQLWTEAHRTLIMHIAPQAIVSGDLSALDLLLHQMSNVDSIDDWNHGGQIYRDATDLILRERSPMKHKTSDTSLGIVLFRLVKNLPRLSQVSFEQRVARHEISTMAIRLLLRVERGKDLQSYSNDIATQSTSTLCTIGLASFNDMTS